MITHEQVTQQQTKTEKRQNVSPCKKQHRPARHIFEHIMPLDT